MLNLNKVLFLIGMLVCFIDIPYIPVGDTALKMAYLIFPLYLLIMLYRNRLRLNKRVALVGSIFFAGIIPSVLLSIDIRTSLQFVLGTAVCLVIMSSMYRLSRSLGNETIPLMLIFYRTTIIATIPLVALRLQPRGHFTLYEASYWAIALIPYYCIAFHRLLTQGWQKFRVDGLFMLLAVVLSVSVSMVIWIIVSYVMTSALLGRLKFKLVLGFVLVSSLFFAIAYFTNDRAQRIVSSISSAEDWEAFLNAILLIGGNRVQRVLVAYQAWHNHPIFGVGIGALKQFTGQNFRASDFLLNGQSASDFDTSLPATNMLLELAAETGVIGLIAFLVLLAYIFRECRYRPQMLPFKVAMWLTLLSLIIESTYLRPYVWMLYGITLGLSSGIEKLPHREGAIKRLLQMISPRRQDSTYQPRGE